MTIDHKISHIGLIDPVRSTLKTLEGSVEGEDSGAAGESDSGEERDVPFDYNPDDNKGPEEDEDPGDRNN